MYIEEEIYSRSYNGLKFNFKEHVCLSYWQFITVVMFQTLIITPTNALT